MKIDAESTQGCHHCANNKKGEKHETNKINNQIPDRFVADRNFWRLQSPAENNGARSPAGPESVIAWNEITLEMAGELLGQHRSFMPDSYKRRL